jgi:hypothetical protein
MGVRMVQAISQSCLWTMCASISVGAMRDSYAETYSGTQTAASPHPGRAGVWHYEYALFNMNLDRAIQSFSGPLGTGVNVSNIGFHATPQHPGWAHDGRRETQARSPGTRERLRLIRTPTRFAGAHSITSASTPTSRRRPPMRQ